MTRSQFVLALSAGAANVAFAATPSRAASSVNVDYATSLQTVMDTIIAPAALKAGLELHADPKGAAALATLVRTPAKIPDVIIAADVKMFDGFVPWYATFGATRMVVAYAASGPFAGALAAAARGEKRIADVLLSPGIKLGRTDPAVDAKGYRTIVCMRLLEASGAAPAGFAGKVLGDDRNPAQIFSDDTLVSRLESGELDAGFLYATEVVARKLPIIDLPAAVNLGDAAQATHYATASVTVDGVKRTGAPIFYAMTIPNGAPSKIAAESFVTFLLSHEGRTVLDGAGVVTGKATILGDRSAAPSAVRALVE